MSVEHMVYEQLNDMAGMAPKDIYEQLIVNYPANIVNFVMDDEFGYIHTKTEERLTRTDTLFKSDVRNRYNNRCIISGASATTQVSHIKPFSESNKDERYDPNNGLLLRDDLHTLFDRHDLIIDPDTSTVQISDDLMNNPFDSCYHCFNGMVLNINQLTINYLRKKYE